MARVACAQRSCRGCFCWQTRSLYVFYVTSASDTLIIAGRDRPMSCRASMNYYRASSSHGLGLREDGWREGKTREQSLSHTVTSRQQSRRFYWHPHAPRATNSLKPVLMTSIQPGHICSEQWCKLTRHAGVGLQPPAIQHTIKRSLPGAATAPASGNRISRVQAVTQGHCHKGSCRRQHVSVA